MEPFTDFVLRIGPRDRELFPITVVIDGIEEGSDCVSLPFTLGEIQDGLDRFGLLINQQEDGPSIETAGWDHSNLCITLFQTLFPPKIHKMYRQSFARCQGRLRLILEIDPFDASCKDWMQLPWELMRAPNQPSPIAIRRNTTFHRFLDLGDPQRTPPPLPREPRALVLRANIKGDVDMSRIKEDLDKVWGRFPGKIEYIPGTVAALEAAIQDGPFHIFHFVGHGGYKSIKQPGGGKVNRWALGFEHPIEPYHPVDGELLAGVLENFLPALRLVTLIACDGCRFGKDSYEVFNNVAQDLIMAGIPAVVAMQFGISHAGAYTFNKSFYEHLALGEAVEAAVNKGRNNLFTTYGRKNMEWGVPVLFSGLEDGRLFEKPRLQVLHVNTLLVMPNMPFNDDEADILRLDLSDRFTRHGVLEPYKWEDAQRTLIELQSKLDISRPILVCGKYILSLGLALGYAFNRTSGFVLRVLQNSQQSGGSTQLMLDEIWRGDIPELPATIRIEEQLVQESGEEVAVALSISRDILGSVVGYLKGTNLPIGQLLHLSPMDGPGNSCIPDGNANMALVRVTAQEILNIGQACPRVHLFLSAPQAFSVLLGAELNAAGRIQVYEHQNPGYKPSCLLGI